MRAATPTEWLYTAGQSMQIAGQTGCIGHLRADMDVLTVMAFSKRGKATGKTSFSRNLKAS